MRFLLLFPTFVLLSACATMEEEAIIVPEPVMEEAIMQAPSASDGSCIPSDDGIGGTGCPVE